MIDSIMLENFLDPIAKVWGSAQTILTDRNIKGSIKKKIIKKVKK